jgi:hypothetical protein
VGVQPGHEGDRNVGQRGHQRKTQDGLSSLSAG